jgi:hypothetical protein
MKSNSLITGIGLMLASVVLLYACQKQLSATRPNPSISASTTNAAVGEKIALTVANAPAGTHLMWSSTAGSGAAFSAASVDGASVAFNKPGTYHVTCYFVSGAAADSLPNWDTSSYPHDTVPYYPPPPPIDSSNYPHDTTGYPHDTTSYPHDTTTYPHDTTPNYPPPPPPHDSTYYPHDSTSLDSLVHAYNGQIIGKVTITIIVR